MMTESLKSIAIGMGFLFIRYVFFMPDSTPSSCISWPAIDGYAILALGAAFIIHGCVGGIASLKNSHE